MTRGSVAWNTRLSSRKSPCTMATSDGSLALAGRWAGSQAINSSMASIGSVIDARYWRLQRAIWRSK